MNQIGDNTLTLDFAKRTSTNSTNYIIMSNFKPIVTTIIVHPVLYVYVYLWEKKKKKEKKSIYLLVSL
jgi:hypothetical protein